MDLIWVLSRHKIVLPKEVSLDLVGAIPDLKVFFQVDYLDEQRIVKVVVRTVEGTFNIFSSGAIIINSRGIGENNLTANLDLIVSIMEKHLLKR